MQRNFRVLKGFGGLPNANYIILSKKKNKFFPDFADFCEFLAGF